MRKLTCIPLTTPKRNVSKVKNNDDLNLKKENFSFKKKTFWDNLDNHRLFLDNLGKRLKFYNWTDWYKVKEKDIIQFGGFNLLQHQLYNNSYQYLITKVYSEHNWEIWNFQKVPLGFWVKKENHRSFLESLGKKLDFADYHSWYTVDTKIINNYGGAGLLSRFGGSPQKLITSVLTEFPFDPLEFRSGHSHWMNLQNHRQFFDNLGKKLEINSFEDWYDVPGEILIMNGGSSMIHRSNDSRVQALREAYPEYYWREWRFHRTPNKFYSSNSNLREYLDSAAKKFGVRTLDDWYFITSSQIKTLKIKSFIHRYGGLIGMLSVVYPEHPWNTKDIYIPNKSQQNLFKFAKEIFNQAKKERKNINITTSDSTNQDVDRSEDVDDNSDDVEVHMEYVHPNLKYSTTNKQMEFDVFVPSFNLALEYQGEQHYNNSSNNNNDSNDLEYQHQVNKLNKSSSINYSYGIQGRDEEKAQACLSVGITLISVPFWWDQSIQSLKVIINKERPDIIW